MVSADADTSPHRERRETAPGLLASPIESRLANTDPSECPQGVLKTVQGLRTLGVPAKAPGVEIAV